MKTLFLGCSIVAKICNIFSALVTKLLCFVKKRKLSTSESHETQLPFSIQIQGDKTSTEINLVDWNTWGDEKSPVEEKQSIEEMAAEELFKDMEPVINKAKVVHVKKKVKAPPKSPALSSPFVFQPHSNDGLSNSFKPQFQVESELGAWVDEENGWDDEVDENEISMETETIIKENKQLERERRSQEQKRRKLEKEQQRAQRRQEGHIGVKLS